MHMRKIYFVNIITGFLNVLNQLKEALMQNLENSIPEILAQKFIIFYP